MQIRKWMITVILIVCGMGLAGQAIAQPTSSLGDELSVLIFNAAGSYGALQFLEEEKVSNRDERVRMEIVNMEMESINKVIEHGRRCTQRVQTEIDRGIPSSTIIKLPTLETEGTLDEILAVCQDIVNKASDLLPKQ